MRKNAKRLTNTMNRRRLLSRCAAWTLAAILAPAPVFSVPTAPDAEPAEPADTLSRARIADRAMVIAGAGDSRRVPPEVVAILGDGAWKHWMWPYWGSTEQPTAEAVAFSPDSRTLATQAGGSVRLWDVASGRLLRSVRGSRSDPVRFSPDGRVLATATWNCLHLWDVATGNKLHTCYLSDRDAVASAEFTPDGRRLTVVFVERDDIEGHQPDWTKTVWATATGRQLSSEIIEPVERRASEKRAWTTADGRYRIEVDPKASAIMVHDVKRSAEWIERAGKDALASPDGKTLAVNVGGHVELWDLARRKRLHEGSGHAECCTAALFSPDGSLLASSDTQGTVKVWQANTGRELRSIDAHFRRINAIAFSPDGRTLASAANDCAVRIWDVASGREVGKADVPGRGSCAGALAFSPDGRTLATGIVRGPGSVVFWNTATWTPRGEVPPGVGDAGASLAFSPDGRLVAGGRTWIMLWDAAKGQAPWGPTDPNAMATYVAFSPDGKTILSAYHERPGAVLWDVATGREVQKLKDPGSEATSCAVAFHPGGRCVAVADEAGGIRLFDVPGGKLLRTIRLTEHGGAINSLSFSPSGRHLATANSNGTVYVLRL